MTGLLIIIIMFLNAQKYQYLCFNPHTSLSCNVYTSSSLDIIDYSRHLLDLGIYVSSDCSFEFHITSLNKRTTHLTGWILRAFSSRHKLTMLTLFMALVMYRLDYGSQLWSPYLTKHINMIVQTQRKVSLWYARSVISRETYCFEVIFSPTLKSEIH